MIWKCSEIWKIYLLMRTMVLSWKGLEKYSKWSLRCLITTTKTLNFKQWNMETLNTENLFCVIYMHTSVITSSSFIHALNRSLYICYKSSCGYYMSKIITSLESAVQVIKFKNFLAVENTSTLIHLTRWNYNVAKKWRHFAGLSCHFLLFPSPLCWISSLVPSKVATGVSHVDLTCCGKCFWLTGPLGSRLGSYCAELPPQPVIH